MTLIASECFMLTPAGALHAFSSKTPEPHASTLQALLTGERALDMAAWSAIEPLAPSVLGQALENGWVQVLQRSLQGPDARLDDFLQYVIASLSDERRAVLASDAGFCLGRAGVEQDEADVLCAAAADYSDFAARQARRGWQGASHYVAFHRDAEFLQPEHVFMPFWVDGTGYWLILMGEPLLNNPALVELMWGLKQAGTRFDTLG